MRWLCQRGLGPPLDSDVAFESSIYRLDYNIKYMIIILIRDSTVYTDHGHGTITDYNSHHQMAPISLSLK